MRSGVILQTSPVDTIYVPPRHLIYCWECDEVEIMEQGVASDRFARRHADHSTETQTIEIRYMTNARAA